MKKSARIIVPLVLLLGVVMISSCKKSESVKAIITVLQDTIVLVVDSGGVLPDTTTGPVIGAEVRFWADPPSEVDTTILTNTQGIAEIEFDQPLIPYCTVTYGSKFEDLGLTPMDEAGDVWEETVHFMD
jgi:hypothetical protein